MPDSQVKPQYLHGGQLAAYCAAQLQSAKAIVEHTPELEFQQLPSDVIDALMAATYACELLGNEARLTSALEGSTAGLGLRAIEGGK